MSSLSLRPQSPPDAADGPQDIAIEIFVRAGFSPLELASVTAVLDTANDVQGRVRFAWNFCSDTPGLVANGNVMVRADPALDGDFLKDMLVILGGEDCATTAWMKRLRAMQRARRPVVLFSEAATEFVKSGTHGGQAATTHWRDIPILNELGDFSDLSTQLAEQANGIVTSAGRGHAMEVTFTLIADLLDPRERSELAALLILDGVRGFQREQPRGAAQGSTFLEAPLRRAIHLMEESIEEPLPISALVKQVGISSRQLERLFRIHLNSSPAKTYKLIRLKRARALLAETRMPLIEIALACGFSSAAALSKSFRQAFGVAPNSLRKKSPPAKG